MRCLARATLSCALPGIALAGPSKGECVDADTEGQELRLHDKVVEARRQLEICASPTCPALVSDDCKQRLEELSRVTPTVVLVARDAAGAVQGLTVTMDGVRIPVSRDVTQVELDPGDHTFVFEAPGREALTRVVSARLRQKGQRVAAEWQQPSVALTQPTPVTSERRGITPMQTAGIVVGAVGAAALAVGAGFGAAAYASWGSVKNECLDAPTCDVTRATADRNTAMGFATASDASFVVGAALVVTGVVLLLLGPAHRTARWASALMLPLGATF